MATERSHARLSSLKKSRKFRDRARKESRRLHLEQLEDRRVMAVFVLPNNGALLQNGETRTVAPKDLTFRFTDIPGIDPTTIDNGIRLVRAGHDGSFGQANDVVVPIGFAGLGDNNREVVMRFAETLPDDTYQITIVGSGADPLRDISGDAFNNGVDVIINFRLDLGAQVVAVVPQPVRRLPNGTLSMTDLFAGNPNPRSTQNVIHVYFNNDDLDAVSATRPEFYRLYITKDTLDPADDTEILPTLVEYDANTNLVRLTFGQVTSLDQLGTPDGSRDPIKSFRLRVGTDEVRRDLTTTTRLGVTDPGSSFGTAFDIGGQITAGAQGTSVQFAQAIEPQDYDLRWPGGLDDPGHRQVPIESHLLGTADLTGGTPFAFYNFRSLLGIIPDGTGGGEPAFNFITEAQKQRTREIFELYSRYSGIQFIETEFAGITVATGDMRVVDPAVPIQQVTGIAGGLLAVMDNNDVWDDSYGGNWFQTAMHEIGHVLGQGHTYDLPPLTIQGSGVEEQPPIAGPAAEPVFPGDHDIVHIRHMFRPDSKDIDMYRFTLDSPGVLTVESFAERLPNSSVLDTTLRLYRVNPNTGIIEEIARNDDYFSEDSLIKLNLEAGTYFVGVSAAGNDQYDPSILDSGMGGTSQGEYEIKFDFQKTGSQSLVDATNASGLIADTLNVPLDGDADGVAGGVFNFWFRAAPLIPIAGRARTIFVDKQAPAGGNGLISAPFRNIDDAMNAELIMDYNIVRIVGNGGADGNLATLQDNLAYQIGFNDFTQELPDGPELTVKKNVTVMIDAGAIFQMRRSQVSVGSTAPSIFSDRSGGALQVLGTPTTSVFFTSYDQIAGVNNIGLDQNPLNIAPREGNWGGLSFRNDLDRADGRFDHEAVGVFLNYVNYADIRYGGGQVNVNSVFEVVPPVTMVDRRPTITNNLITISADAAMAANPDSFEETNFQAPRFWPTFANDIFHNPSGVPGVPNPSASFTLDYDRVGPEIHGNRLLNNTTNGLFVRTRTPAGNVLEELIVAGRFNDTDIVHIVQENLVVRGTPGGPILDTSPPPITLVIPSVSPLPGNFAAGTNVEYRLTFVDLLGNEGAASAVFSGPVIVANGSAVRLIQLPDVAPGFVARKLYRRTSPTGEFILVDQIPASVSTYDDTNRPISGVPQVLRVNGAIPLVVATVQEGTGTLNEIQTIARPTTFGSFTLSFSGQTTTVLDSRSTAAQVQAALAALTTIGPGNVIVRTSDPLLIVEFTGILANQDVPQITGFSLEVVQRPRLDASLVIDPSIIIKSDGARIDVDIGATLYAEAVPGLETVFTSLADDRYGAGGTFDTNTDDQILPTDPAETAAEPGDWGGIFFFADSTGSIDNAVIAYAGGLSRVEGTFAGINPVEIHQADVRIAQSKFEFNDDGQGGQAPPNRFGRGFNAPGLIFIRGAQPVILGNTVIENDGPFISVNVNALSHETVVDQGRQTGLTERAPGNLDNNGPLIEGNRLRDNDVNGMIVRGGTLTTESVWDDTDIVHVLLDEVIVPDFHTFGGLRIESSPTESLVVKAAGATAGITATGRPLEIDDRIGGIVQILGQPGFPVVMTGFSDDTEGAGFTPEGIPQTDTDGGGTAAGGLPTGPEANNGTLIDNDVANNVVGHFEFRPGAGGISLNSGVTAQGQTQLFVNQDFIFDFINYVDIGPNGSAIDLSTTTITTPPTLIAPDLVISEGTFAGANGTVNWRVETSIANGSTRVNNKLILNSTAALGALRFINYLDEDVLGPSDDLLYQVGSPGQANFRLFTLDNAERIGFSQGGVYLPSTGLVNATYDGFAADEFADLRTAITGGGTTYSPTGNIDTVDLPPFVDPALGSVHGLADVTTAMAWTVDPLATTATLTSFLELVAEAPATSGTPGEWQGITIDQWAHDRNVETILEQEATLGDGAANATPQKAQFIGAIGPFEKGGDENLRLGFTVRGLLNNNNDVDIYSFSGRTGTEVWIDIDRTTHALDSIIELVDVNGNVLARSDNSFNENLPTNDAEFENRFGIALTQHKAPPYQGSDFYTTNPRDPGLRVLLPGPANTTNTYFVRVRSGTASQVNVLVEGKTGLVTELVRGATNRATEIMQAGGPTFTTAIQGNSGSVTELVKGFLANSVEAMRGGGPVITTTTPGGGGTNEVQHIEFTPVVPSAGFFTLTFNGETTGLIPFNASGTVIQAALEALTTIGNGNVSVSGGAGGPWDVTFQGALANTDVNQLTAASNEFQQVTAPGAGDFTLTFQGQTTSPIPAGASAGQVQAELEALSNIDNDDVAVSGNPGGPWTIEFLGAFANQNVSTMAISAREIQRVTLAGLPTGGTFILTFEGQNTTPIPFDADAPTVEAALVALLNILPGEVAVTKPAGNTWDVAFQGAKGAQDITPITIAVDEVQTFTLPGNPTGGTFTLTFGGQTTGPLAFNAAAVTVQTALNVLSSITPNTVSVTKVGNTWSVAFSGGALANTDVGNLTGATNEFQRIVSPVPGGALTVSFNGLVSALIPASSTALQVQGILEAITGGPGTVSVTIPVAGTYDVEFRGPLAGLPQNEFVIFDVQVMQANAVVVATTQEGGGGNNERQSITLPSNPVGGNFRLTFGGSTTVPIAFNASTATVQAALQALGSINGPNVLVTGAPGNWQVQFVGTLANTNVNPITGTNNEFQRVIAPSGSPGFSLIFNGQATIPISATATAGEVQAALVLLNNIGPSDVLVTGSPGGPWDIEFRGAFAGQDVSAMAVGQDEEQLISIPADPEHTTFTLTFQGQTTAPIGVNASAAAVQAALEALPNIGVGNVFVNLGPGIWRVRFGGTLAQQDQPLLSVTINEVQRLAFQTVPTGGFFTLTFDGQTTGLIPFNASPVAVQLALEALSNIGIGDVAVTGIAGSTYDIEFRGALAGDDVPTIELDGRGLLGAGLTSGAYQLQLRLREVDELGGSAIRFTKIANAVNGIHVVGQPTHSPLGGEAAEVNNATNNTLAGAQFIGNLLNSDRSAIALAGSMSAAGDVDFYAMDVNYDATQGIFPFSSLEKWWSTIFDIDYADGFARPNLMISVFDPNGQLIFTGRDSNIADDRGNPINSSDVSDLSRGSSGIADPWIGSAELPEGRYLIAVHNEGSVPAVLNQVFTAAATAPLTRLEPMDSVQRIVEDHISFDGGSTGSAPIVPNFINTDPLDPNFSFIPWSLHDVTLFVSRDLTQPPAPEDAPNTTQLVTIDPFSGITETVIGNFGQNIGDLAVHPAGRLYTYSTSREREGPNGFRDAQAGNYYQIDVNANTVNLIGDDGITTFMPDNSVPPAPVQANDVPPRVGEGVHFSAMTIGSYPGNPTPNNIVGLAVGGRDGAFGFALPGQGVDNINVLYAFLPDTGAATSFPASNKTGAALLTGNMTDVIERGILDTLFDINPTNANAIIAAEATLAGGVFNIKDANYTPPLPPMTAGPAPTRFQVGAIQFEFDAGPEALINISPTLAGSIRDGNNFFVDAKRMEFDTGPVINVLGPGNTINFPGGSSLTITDVDPDPLGPGSRPPRTIVFEFTATGTVTIPNALPIRVDGNPSNQAMADRIVTAINSQQAGGFTTQAVRMANTGRISLTNLASLPTINGNDDSDGSLAGVNPAGAVIEGALGTNDGNAVRLRIEETSTQVQLATTFALANASGTMPVNTQVGVSGPAGGTNLVTAGFDTNRLNFSGATTIVSPVFTNPAVFRALGNQGGTVGGLRVPVPFLAQDDQAAIAARMATAVVGAGFATAFSTPTGMLTGGPLVSNITAPLQQAGQAPGGRITGMTTITQNNGSSRTWAVSSNGGLYEVVNQFSLGGATLDYINTATDLVGINFGGLTAGPRNIEGQRYLNTLFGISTTGRLFAFNTQGFLQRVFQSARNPSTGEMEAVSSVQTGVTTGVNGLAFSNLNANSWGTTNVRALDQGHGLNVTHDESREPPVNGTLASIGGTSLRFGGGNYNLLGGAHGSIESEYFSLKGYAAGDKPTLYFSYFLDTENVGHSFNPAILMRDALRVFVAGDDGVWNLLTTSDSSRFPGTFDDDFDYAPLRVQETFDNTGGWRQVRVPLGDFAGRDNLRLRFDFSTAAAMNLGTYVNEITGAFNTQTGGDELRAVEGTFLRDGQRFTLTAGDANNPETRTFEFDMGFTLVAPNGAAIPDGARFTIDGITFEFDKNGTLPGGVQPVRILSTDSPAQVAQKIAIAIDVLINQPFPPGNPFVFDSTQYNDNRVNLRSGTPGNVVGATSVTATGMPVTFIEGAPGTLLSSLPIPVHAGMDRFDVRESIALEMAAEYAGGDRAQIKTHRETIRLLGQVDPIFGTPIGGYRFVSQFEGPNADGTNQRLLGVSTTLPGDVWGSFNSSLRGQNNIFEGIYLDDIIIGFSERGEMVTGAPNNSGFTANPQTDAANIVVGPYQLEVRRAAEAGVPNPFGPPDLALLGSIDTNDRLAQSRQLVAAPGNEINDGQFFTISDGINSLSFEFNDLTIPGSGVVQGRVRIDYNPRDTDYQIAQRVRNAVNSAQVQAVLKVVAQLGDGALGSASTSNQVNLIGAVSVPNTGGGGSLPVPLPTIGEVNNGTLIDNDTLEETVGHMEVRPLAGGAVDPTVITSDFGATIQFEPQAFNNIDIIFQYLSFVDVGSDGNAISLLPDPNSPVNSAVITQIPTLIGEDLVESRGEFPGQNGIVRWVAHTRIEDGTRVIGNTLTFESDQPLGNLRYLNYFDQEVLGTGGDLIYLKGTPGDADFRVVTLDSATRTGFSLGGVYDAGPGLVNATYEGFASDAWDLLLQTILGPGTTYTETGNITANLPEFFDDRLGRVFGLGIPTTAMAWAFDPLATTATISTSLELVQVLDSNPLGFRTYNEEHGDSNRFRDQGQIILQGNEIKNSSEWGILIDAAARNAVDGSLSHNGPNRNLRELNVDRLVPGVVVVNNVVHNNGLGGLRISGDTTNVNIPDAPVPFVRAVNNTFFGQGGSLTGGAQTDIGIRVDETAAPTLLNNIVANFNLGVSVDASSQGPNRTILGGMLFQGNDTNSNVGIGGDFPILLSNNQPLFVNSTVGNFYLKAQSPAIDSSVDSLLDRASLVTVRSPLGIPPSPIISPDRDGVGQLRVDDPGVSTPQGFGLNPFKDRGAIDRVDFTGPTGQLINPPDNDSDGLDLDPADNVVVRTNDIIRDFRIRLFDRADPNGPPEGSDVDDLSVSGTKVKLETVVGATTTVLVEGVDYSFSYDSTNNLIVLTPLGGLWPLSTTYRITLDNSLATGITDKAGNPLQANQIDGTHIYTIFLGSAIDWGDAPATPTLAPNGANHQVVAGVRLGATVGADTDGQPSPAADLDTSDDGVTDIVLSRGGLSSFTVVASAVGKIDAWLDLNLNNVFDDPAEYVVAGFDITTPDVAVPVSFNLSNGPQGPSYLRVRFSTAGIATPGGAAPDGEVEDYLVTMVGPAFHNGILAEDVDNNGIINTVDLLIVLNFINFLTNELISPPGVLTLPVTSPPYKPTTPTFDPTGGGIPGQGKFIDVVPDAQGNFGQVSQSDLLAIINWLTINFQPGGGGAGGEGEAEGEGGSGPAAAALRGAVPGAASPSSASGGISSSLGALLATSSLYASSSVLLEERMEGGSVLEDASWLDSGTDDTLELVSAGSQGGYAIGQVLSLSDHANRKLPMGPLDEDAWDQLLSDLSLDVGGLPGEDEDPS